MIGTALLFILLALLLLGSFMISGLLVRKATYQVVDRFCTYHALAPRKARSIQELGLVPADFWHRMFRPRDYKPYALQFLRKAGVVKMTQDGKLYLAQEKLHDSLKCRRS
jgi:hypothetical protein